MPGGSQKLSQLLSSQEKLAYIPDGEDSSGMSLFAAQKIRSKI